MFKTRRNEADKRARSHRCWRSERGFTSIEMAICCAIIGIAIGGSMMIADNVLPVVRADSSLQVVVSGLRQAREAAMDQNQNVTVTFTSPNEITISPNILLPRSSQPGSQLVYTLGQGLTFGVVSGVADTPDGFDSALTPVCFQAANSPCATAVIFQGDGTAVIVAQGSPSNGTVFMAIPGKALSARALTVMGATGHIQGYRYTGVMVNGSQWSE